MQHRRQLKAVIEWNMFKAWLFLEMLHRDSGALSLAVGFNPRFVSYRGLCRVSDN